MSVDIDLVEGPRSPRRRPEQLQPLERTDLHRREPYRLRRAVRPWQDDSAVETMRAIRKRESGPGLTLDEVPVPTPGPDEVLVRIEAASICGTDLHYSAGISGRRSASSRR